METRQHAGRQPRRSPRRGLARVGTSGWRYPRWRGDFYPPAATTARAALSRRAARYGGDQWDLLLTDTSRDLRRLAERRPGRVRLGGEGEPVHHAHAQAAEFREATGQLLRLWPVATRRRHWGQSYGSFRRSSPGTRLARGHFSPPFPGTFPQPNAGPADMTEGPLAARRCVPPAAGRCPFVTRSRSVILPGSSSPALRMLRDLNVALVAADTAGGTRSVWNGRPISRTSACTERPHYTRAATPTAISTSGRSASSGGRLRAKTSTSTSTTTPKVTRLTTRSGWRHAWRAAQPVSVRLLAFDLVRLSTERRPRGLG